DASPCDTKVAKFLPPRSRRRCDFRATNCRMPALLRQTMVVALFFLGSLAGTSHARENVYRGILVAADGSQSRFRFTITSCSTEGGTTLAEGGFSPCRHDPCPATKGNSTITFAANGSISIVLEANGGRLACTLA